VSPSADGKNPWKVVGDVFLKLINRAPEKMSEAEWIVYRVWSLLGEVSNGGFDQYFFNSSGDHATRTRDALRAIGDTKGLKVLEEAMAVFPGEVSDDRDIRWKQLDGLSKSTRESFEALDKKLVEAGQDVVEKLAAYIEAHSKEIRPTKERGGRRHT